VRVCISYRSLVPGDTSRSYRENPKNVFVCNTFVVVPVDSVETRMNNVCVCVYVCVCVCTLYFSARARRYFIVTLKTSISGVGYITSALP
jgi:hypothetical protein